MANIAVYLDDSGIPKPLCMHMSFHIGHTLRKTGNGEVRDIVLLENHDKDGDIKKIIDVPYNDLDNIAILEYIIAYFQRKLDKQYANRDKVKAEVEELFERLHSK